MAAGAAAGAAVIANAMKAIGGVVRVSPENFLAILARAESPLIVHARGGIFTTYYQYIISYKGLIFYTKSRSAVELPRGVELVHAERIWIPQ
jgi:hypothetical protein